MSTKPSEALLSQDEVLMALTELGEDPLAGRVEQLRDRIDASTLPAGDREAAVRAAVDAARAQLDAGTADLQMPAIGAEYSSTDPDFEGKVIVTSVSEDRVFYEGDADGSATLAEFHKAYTAVGGMEMSERIEEGFVLAARRFAFDDLGLLSFHSTQAEAIQAMGESLDARNLSVVPGWVRFAANGNVRLWRTLGQPVAERKLPEPRLFEGNWNHLFGPGRAETLCRIVVDVVNEKLAAAQAFDGQKWVNLSGAERADLAESLFNANDVSANPEQWQLKEATALPEWAQPALERKMPETADQFSDSEVMAGAGKLYEFAREMGYWKAQSGDPTYNDILPLVESASRQTGVQQVRTLLTFALAALESCRRSGDPTISHLLPIAREAVVQIADHWREAQLAAKVTPVTDAERMQQIREELARIVLEGAAMAQRDATPREIADLNARRATLQTERARILYRRTHPGSPEASVDQAVDGNLTGGTHEYLFDVQLDASITINAPSEEIARRALRGELQCASANLGEILNQTIVCEVSLNREPVLVMIDCEDPPRRDVPQSGKLAPNHQESPESIAARLANAVGIDGRETVFRANLTGYAAQAAALELVRSWSQSVRNGDAGKLLADVDSVIATLEAFREQAKGILPSNGVDHAAARQAAVEASGPEM